MTSLALAHSTVPYQIQIQVNAAEMIERKIADHVRALDIVGIFVELRQKPWILFLDKLSAGLVCP
jgi:hypothetical protein